ncbi:MAG: DR2241 family protein [Chthoniobacter sp.]
MQNLAQTLAEWIAGGGREIGELHVEPLENGFLLHHADDALHCDAVALHGAEAARELAQFDEADRFRPLKTAPNLRHGWRLHLADLAELRRALDYFYPAMLGVWFSQQRGRLVPVPCATRSPADGHVRDHKENHRRPSANPDRRILP